MAVDQVERLDEAWRQQRSLFPGALEWLIGTVEQFEALAGPSLADQWETQQRESAPNRPD